METRRPSLEEVRGWPPTVNVRDAARALGVSGAHAYAMIRLGRFPARVITMGERLKVVTSSLVELLEVRKP